MKTILHELLIYITAERAAKHDVILRIYLPKFLE